MRAATFDEKTQVVIVMTISAILTALVVGALWWSCDFASIPQCMGVK